MPAAQPPLQETTRIERLVNGGDGLARIGGRPVFISGVCPGEEVRASVQQTKKGYSRGRLESVVQASSERITPVCPVFEDCGGCQWQHIDYKAQLRLKSDILREDLRRIGKISDPEILPVIYEENPFRYRTRIQLKVCLREGRREIGFFSRNSNRVVPVESCPISSDPINHFLLQLHQCLPAANTPRPSLKEVHVNFSPGAGELQARYFLENESPEEAQELLSNMRSRIPGLISQVIYTPQGRRRVRGRDYLKDRFYGFDYRISDSSFSQIHGGLRENLIRTVLDFTSPSESRDILELYCGIGTFSLALARESKALVGFDENPQAVADAGENAARNEIRSARFATGSVKEAVRKLGEGGKTFDRVVADPPRAGIGRLTLEGILKLKPQKIIYISCSSSTLARDARILADGGFHPKRFQPIDLFPQTHHLETVAEFVRT